MFVLAVPVGALLVAVASGLTSIGAATAQADDKAVPPDAPEMLKQGQALFERDWLKEGKFADSKGNGLGPMHNAVSCVACHKEGSPGGAGKNEHNVDLLALDLPAHEAGSHLVMERATQVHPQFARNRITVVLHRRRLADDGARPDELYDAWRTQLLAAPPKGLSLENPRAEIRGFKVILAQRNTPALFGAGLIDGIPDRVLIELQDLQEDKYPEIAGSVALSVRGQVGRFGWRGQTGRLHDFVLGACANELGLSVPRRPEPTVITVTRDDDTLTASIPKVEPGRNRSRAFRSAPEGLDLTDEQCRSLTAFVGALAPPTRFESGSREHALEVVAGERLFGDIGCVQCHVPDVGDVKGIYSDLLLHDMGAELSDPIIASDPESGYYGRSAARLMARDGKQDRREREWRTPPLWGVGDSAPYLHDGRAATLDEAIRHHGGQGAKAVRAYAVLSVADRNRILEFLASLVASRANGMPPLAAVK